MKHIKNKMELDSALKEAIKNFSKEEMAKISQDLLDMCKAGGSGGLAQSRMKTFLANLGIE